MANLTVRQTLEADIPLFGTARMRQIGLILLLLLVIFTIFALFSAFQIANLEDALIVESTPGQLILWLVEQSAEEAPISWLGQAAKSWAASLGQVTLDVTTGMGGVQSLMRLYLLGVGGLAAVGLVGVIINANWSRWALLLTLIGLDILLFIVPTAEGDRSLLLVLAAIFMLLAVLLLAPGRVTKTLGFLVALSAILMTWEVVKSFAESINYQIGLNQPGWNYQSYETLEDSLQALQNGEITALIIDRKDIQDLMPAFPEEETSDTDYPQLRLLSNIDRETRLAGLPVVPNFPGRLGVAVRADEAEQWTSLSSLSRENLGTVAGSFAEERLLSQPRTLVLLDLKIITDLNLPHLQDIAEALTQPARRNGPLLLVRILSDAGLYTWTEALVGFISGGILGFLLGTLFAHSGLMQRGLLPYVVASQTVPILAIAPMVVIWLGANWVSVAVISAYLTFFPVTINTMRGLESPHPNALELMHSYAASKWTIMWKLRFPAALPYIFTALKVSATASVVGAIIGELPSGIRDGLGRAILDFSSDYSLVSTPKLWGAIFVAAVVGIIFFLIVTLVERMLLPQRPQTQ